MKPDRHEPADAPQPGTQAGGKARSRRRRYDHTLIVQLYTDRLTMQQVAAKVGCNATTVRRALQNADVPRRRRHFPPPPPPPTLTPAQAAEVVRMYAEMKLEVWQIIRRTSHSAPSVKRALREAGIPMRRGKLGKAGWPDADIAYRYQRGDSIGRIATDLGMAEHTVRNRLDARAVARRPQKPHTRPRQERLRPPPHPTAPTHRTDRQTDQPLPNRNRTRTDRRRSTAE
jgi:hypothetical protein